MYELKGVANITYNLQFRMGLYNIYRDRVCVKRFECRSDKFKSDAPPFFALLEHKIYIRVFVR